MSVVVRDHDDDGEEKERDRRGDEAQQQAPPPRKLISNAYREDLVYVCPVALFGDQVSPSSTPQKTIQDQALQARG